MVRRRLSIRLIAFAAAMLAGPLPVVAQPAPVTGLPTSDPAPTNPARPLSADGLAEPGPPVPPRDAYQRPPTAPQDDEPPGVTLPEGATIQIPGSAATGRPLWVGRRYGRPNNITSEKLPDGTQRYIITDGMILFVGADKKQAAMEFATDNAIIWVSGGEPVNDISGGFETGGESKRKTEVYMSGNVIIRTLNKTANQTVSQTLRAEEIYVDVNDSKAIALKGDLELNIPKVPDGIRASGREIRQLDALNLDILGASISSSKLPSDPGLRLDSPRISIQDIQGPRRNFLGIAYQDFQGKENESGDRIMTIRNGVTWLGPVPVFYMPYMRVDVNEPLGPLLSFGGGIDRIFGDQFYTTWDVYKLLALTPPIGTKWQLHLDYLSYRGPGAGTEYNYTVPNRQLKDPDFTGSYLPPDGKGYALLYGISDHGVDNIGYRPVPYADHPEDRGRVLFQHQQEFLDGLYFQGQFAYLSDQNFMEQYYKNVFDMGPNQETFAYATYQQQNYWASGLVQPKVGQDWMTHTEWLPKFDGAIAGETFFDTFVYNARASAGYAELKPSTINPLPVLPTDKAVNTGRVDLYQELSAPFGLGPFKLAPYADLDLADYTEDLAGNNRGRVYGAGGIRGSLAMSRLYDTVNSELFNVDGLYHKVMFGVNYFYARTNTQYSALPQLDRLSDDSLDYTYRYMQPYQTQFVPGAAGVALATSPLFNPQQYAIRRLVDTNLDTLGDEEVIQGDIRQRFQTKRGYPGMEHTVDFLTLDVSASYFPNPARDNYGESWAFLEYNAQWNPGDRVAVLSSGWFDPFPDGTRYWNIGLSVDRPDRTSFYLGYRQTDPLNSKEVTTSVGYQLSRRYFVNLGASYDFGLQKAMSNSLTLTRTGSDLTVSVGFTYNALVNNFGFQFLIVPNLVQALAPGKFGPISPMSR